MENYLNCSVVQPPAPVGLPEASVGSQVLRILPNPAHDRVHIQFPNRILQLDWYSASGVRVRTDAVGATEFDADLQDLPAGVYEIWAQTDSGPRFSRLVVY
jgi:hypothetical protein